MSSRWFHTHRVSAGVHVHAALLVFPVVPVHPGPSFRTVQRQAACPPACTLAHIVIVSLSQSAAIAGGIGMQLAAQFVSAGSLLVQARVETLSSFWASILPTIWPEEVTGGLEAQNGDGQKSSRNRLR